MASSQGRSGAKRVGGVAVLLLGALLMGWGVHYLLENGNCSSTGYVSYGPVPTCHGQEGLYITSVFFLGPALALVGWGLARISGIFATTVCVAWGVGLGTILLDPNAGSGAKASGLVGAIIFAALTVYSVYRTIRKRRQPTPVLPTTVLPTTGLPSPGSAATGLAGTAGPLTPGPSAVPAMPGTGSPGTGRRPATARRTRWTRSRDWRSSETAAR